MQAGKLGHNVRTVLRIRHAKPLGGRVEHLARGLARHDEVVHHQRDVEFRLQLVAVRGQELLERLQRIVVDAQSPAGTHAHGEGGVDFSVEIIRVGERILPGNRRSGSGELGGQNFSSPESERSAGERRKQEERGEDGKRKTYFHIGNLPEYSFLYWGQYKAFSTQNQVFRRLPQLNFPENGSMLYTPRHGIRQSRTGET